jgi:hypothetical protein
MREIIGLPEAERFDALASACQKLGSIVIRPGSASHMHEISVPGSYARAADRQELVLNWLRSGQAMHFAFTELSDVADHQPPPVDIEFHPAKRGIQVADAAARIARPDRCDDGNLISACRIIPANSPDHCGREQAGQLALVLGNGIPGRMCA